MCVTGIRCVSKCYECVSLFLKVGQTGGTGRTGNKST